MKKVILVAREDREMGELGWLAKGTKLMQYPMVATEGRLIAHDLLEHPNGVDSIGSIDDELEALGGIWYVRGHYCDLSRNKYSSNYSPEESIASDICKLCTYYMQGVDFHTPVPRTKAHDYDDSFREIIEIGIKQLRDELECWGQEDIDWARLQEYRDACIHYMRSGARKTKKRFPNQNSVNSMFWLIAEAIDNSFKPVFEYQELKLSYDMTELRACAEEHYEDDMYA